MFPIQTANLAYFQGEKKIQLSRIFCVSGWLVVPINPDKWSCTVTENTAILPQNRTRICFTYLAMIHIYVCIRLLCFVLDST